MTSYILPQALHGETHHALVMGSGYAQAVDRLSTDLLIMAAPGEQADLVMAIMASSRHLATSLQEAADQLESLEELSGEEVKP